MTPQNKIKALAELDGHKVQQTDYKTFALLSPDHRIMCVRDSEQEAWNECPDYLTNYDAIIPLIQNQPIHVQKKVAWILWFDNAPAESNLSPAEQTKADVMLAWNRTPTQLADALLIATGKMNNV